jgi:hypothetical protein
MAYKSVSSVRKGANSSILLTFSAFVGLGRSSFGSNLRSFGNGRFVLSNPSLRLKEVDVLCCLLSSCSALNKVCGNNQIELRGHLTGHTVEVSQATDGRAMHDTTFHFRVEKSNHLEVHMSHKPKLVEVKNHLKMMGHMVRWFTKSCCIFCL